MDQKIDIAIIGECLIELSANGSLADTSTLNKFFDLNREECENKAYINKNKADSPLKMLFIAAITLSVLFLFVSAYFIYIPFGVIISSVICLYALSIRPRLLTDGERSLLTWKGLEKFMLEFSRMKEYSTMELALWEEYLVYATAFGIADKVLKQLKVVYPQITDANYMNSNGYTYLYLMYHSNISNNFINSINTSVTSAYSSVNYSSGSGSGGGFSGGGGFGGGGGRNGRTLIYY